MKTRNAVALMVLVTSIVACATSDPALQKRIEETVPICVGEADCEAKWEAAQLWVAKNAGMKLQIVTDVVIETYNPGPNSPSLGVKVTKEPLGSGQYRLRVVTWCNNMFGCVPNHQQAALNFNEVVGAAVP